MEEYEVRTLRPSELGEMEALLARQGLRRDALLDYSAGAFAGGTLAAVGSCAGNTLRCLAVEGAYRGEGLLNRVVEHLVRVQYGRGNFHLFLYTKGASARFFEDLGFTEIARDGERTVFMENRKNGFPGYLERLGAETSAARLNGPVAALVMNANPFTLGHQYLARYAAGRCGALHLFVVSEDASVFPAPDRLELVKAGTAELKNVIYHGTDSYLISRATFPSYFLTDDESATLSQARLDGAVFAKIAAALEIRTRFLGSEPKSRVTALYNRALEEALPDAGVACEIIPRMELDGAPVSASTVRRALKEGDWARVEALTPPTTLAYLRSARGEAVAAHLREMEEVEH